MKLSDQVRQAIDASGMTWYRIRTTLGLAESTMSRFMSGKGGLSLEVLDALADLLNLNLTTNQRHSKKRKRE